MNMIMMDHWSRQGNATLAKHAGHEKRYTHTQPHIQEKWPKERSLPRNLGNQFLYVIVQSDHVN